MRKDQVLETVDVPLYVKFWPKLTHHFQKRRLSIDFRSRRLSGNT